MRAVLQILMIVLSLTFFACTAKKKGKQTRTKTHQENTLSLKAKSYNPQFTWLKGKINISMEGSDIPLSLNANLRMKKDSVIWISASVMGFPVAKLLFTKDTVIIIDHQTGSGRYFSGTYARINDSLKTNISYALVQSIIIGEFYPMAHDSVYQSYVEPPNLLYCTPEKALLTSAIQNNSFANTSQPLHAIWIYGDSSNVQRVYYQEPLKKVILDISYISRSNDGYKFPKITQVIMKDKNLKEKIIHLDFTKAEPQETSLDTEIIIPDGYEKLR